MEEKGNTKNLVRAWSRMFPDWANTELEPLPYMLRVFENFDVDSISF